MLVKKPGPIAVDSLSQKFLLSEEVATLLRCSLKTVQRYRRARKLAYIRRGGRFLFPRTSIETFLASRTVQAA